MKKLIFVSIILSVLGTSSRGQTLKWEPTNGPYWGPFTLIPATGNVIFATYRNGRLYRSTDNGDTWSLSDISLRSQNVMTGSTTATSIAVDQSGAFYLGVEYFAEGNNPYAGVFRSIDSGATWNRVDIGLSDPNVFCLLARGTSIFAGTESGVFRSTNNGATWSEIDSGFGNTASGKPSIYGLAANGTTLFTIGYWESNDNMENFYRSTDNGSTWIITGQNQISGLEQYGIDTVVVRGQTCFVVENGFLWRSTDDGIDWTQLSTARNFIFENLANESDGIFASIQDSGVYRSTDSGITWTQVSPNVQLVYSYVSGNGDSTIFAVDQFGIIYRSINNGNFWTQTRSGPLSARVGDLVTKDGWLFAAAGGMYRSNDGGNKWESIDAGLQEGTRVCVVSGDDLFVGGICRSSNDGETWTKLYYNSPDIAAGGADLYIASGDGILFSTDSGVSWQQSSDLPSQIPASSIIASDSSIFVITSYGGGVDRSTDFGITWITLFPLALSPVVESISLNNSEVFLGTYDSGAYRSTDNGNTWSNISTGLQDTSIMTITCFGDTLLCASYNGNVYWSSNDGDLWIPCNSGLPASYNHCFAKWNNIFYAGTDSGVYRATPSSSVSQPMLMGEVDMSAFPNPLISSAILRYSLASPSSVTISIFDALGRQVASPVIGEEQDAGDHQATLDAHGLAPGVYTCRLIANAEEQSAKVVVTR